MAGCDFLAASEYFRFMVCFPTQSHLGLSNDHCKIQAMIEVSLCNDTGGKLGRHKGETDVDDNMLQLWQ